MAETSGGAHPVDVQLWQACAGSVTHLPQVGSSVVYFPQGHAEQASPLPPLDLPRLPPAISCKVLRIEFLADSLTDEAYACMRLQPSSNPWFDLDVNTNEADGDVGLDDSPFCESKAMSFAKTLTQSDANNGGGFSIPRYCAETIFPRLDYAQTPPVQTVLAKDVHGTVWKFRHIYRGTPRRHLLTTGWSNFVNQKKLVAGDVIVFMRTNAGELCIGIRRAIRSTGHYRMPASCGLKVGVDQNLHLLESCKPPSLSMALCNKSASFSRHRNPVTVQSVLEAVTAASLGQSFEILYYPRATTSEFCVKSHLVKRSLRRSWAPGMRFKMAIETDDASRTSWYMGTILKVEDIDPVSWPKSPWKVLQVTWDEGVLQGIERVSPWQVDLVSPMLLPPLSLPRKRSRLLQARDTQHEGPDDAITPLVHVMSDYAHDPWHELTTRSMEGARHKSSYEHAVRDFEPANWPWNSSLRQQPQQLKATDIVLNLGLVPSPEGSDAQNHQLIALTVGSSSNSEPDVSALSCCDEGVSVSPKCTRFLLFGKAIDISLPARMEPLSSECALDAFGQETTSDGLQSDLSLSAQDSTVETTENPHAHTQHGESFTLNV